MANNKLFFLFAWMFLYQDTSFASSVSWGQLGSNPSATFCVLPKAGWENPRDFFVCRAYHNNKWVPGKLRLPIDEGPVCQIAEHGKAPQYRTQDTYQVLFHNYECTSWIKTSSPNQLPPSAIEGGHHPDETIAYICRHDNSAGKIIIGKYSAVTGKCYYPLNANEYATSTNVEVLIDNC